jgi:hypothetical protein
MSKDTTLQIAAEHYESLRGYLASHIQKLMRESGQVKSKSASARDKLMKLNKSQFQELATDVYDEMKRRTDEHAFPFLPVRDDFHPKRNQARQKLATLSTNRFRDLATDIYYEIERRFPSVTKSIQERMPLEPYSPKQYQYPERNMDRYPSQEKSSQEKYARDRSRERNERDRDRDRMRERDYPPREREYSQRKDSSNTPPDYQKPATSPAVNVSSLDNLMADIGSMLTSPRSQSSTLNKEASSNEINQLKKDHEDEINKLQKEIDELKTEVQDLKASLEEKTNALEVSEEKVKKMQSDYDEKEKECKDLLEEKEKLVKDYEDLENEHQNLQEDYESREQMAKDIRQEVANLLDEVKVLQEKNEDLIAEKEKMEETIRKLKENQDTKEDNYSRRSSSKDRSPKEKESSAVRSELGKIFDDIGSDLRDGIIQEDRVDAYEDAINNLLDAKESEKPTSVLVAMKAIVISCKTITEDIEKFENASNIRSDEREHLDNLKNYLSESLTTLMTSAKSYATSQGKSPVPELEDSLLSLTDSVVDLIRYARDLKIDLRGGASSRRKEYKGRESSNAKSVPELKDFIKDNTDKIVVSIQSLLYNLRESNSFDNEFLDIVSGITSIVDDIINESHDTLDNLSASDYKPDIENILLDLTNSNSKLDELGQKMISSPQSKSTKQQIASASYDIANYVKNLINNLN